MTMITQVLLSVKPVWIAPGAGPHAAKLDVPIPAGELMMLNERLLGAFAGSM